MPYHAGDTICAIGTAPGGAARGMIRVSGPDAVAVVERVFAAADGHAIRQITTSSVIEGWIDASLDFTAMLPSRVASWCRETKNHLPCNLLLWPTQRSYTREPVAELHTIGSPPLMQAVLKNLCAAGARLAEPGEFTLRAFLAGRIDLTQAEAVLGVIDARGDEELNAALVQLAGGLAQPLHTIRSDLMQLLAELEAGLDFVEEDIRFISQRDTVERLAAARIALDAIAQQLATRNFTKELPQVVLIGRPNVGKSSLFNALVARFGSEAGSTIRAAAIVSPVRGTTRDYLTATVVFGNRPLELIDTAGIDDADNETGEIHGLARNAAIERSARASLRLLCLETPFPTAVQNIDFSTRSETFDMIVLTKADRSMHAQIVNQPGQPSNQNDVPFVRTSSVTGEGLEGLVEIVVQLLDHRSSSSSSAVGATADRCRESVRSATTAIEAATKLAQQSSGDELVATEIRLALDEIGKMVGATYTDDLLDRIFKTFCIGK